MKTKLNPPMSAHSQAELLIASLSGCIHHSSPEEVASKAIDLVEEAQASFADKALLSAYLMAIARDLLGQWKVDAMQGSVTAEQREEEEDENKLIGLSVALGDASNDCDKAADLLFNLAQDCPESIR